MEKWENWVSWKGVLSVEIDVCWLCYPKLTFRAETLHFFSKQWFKLLYQPLYWRKFSSCPRKLQFRDRQRSSVSSEGMVCTNQWSFWQGFYETSKKEWVGALSTWGLGVGRLHGARVPQSMEMLVKQVGLCNMGIVGWRQGRQKDLLQSTGQCALHEKAYCDRRLKDSKLALLDKYDLVRHFGRGRGKSA